MWAPDGGLDFDGREAAGDSSTSALGASDVVVTARDRWRSIRLKRA